MAIKNKIGFISLGCPKATVDSEKILTRLLQEGYELVNSYSDADLVIINTCAFITAAEEESINCIKEALRDNGKVIVTGCLGAQKAENGKKLVKEVVPDVLSVSGPDALSQVMRAVHKHLTPPHAKDKTLLPAAGVKLTPHHYAYLKISEGCSHQCTFCIIPSLRGPMVSYSMNKILREAKVLFESGVKELLIIAQDTSAYGIDSKFKTVFLGGKPVRSNIISLTKELAQMAKSYGAWVRLHYVYPYPYVEKLVEIMTEGGVVPYLDVPFQHSHPDVLKRMNRPASGEHHLEQIKKWRSICPELTIRSSFIVGFPGESKKEFEHLLQFIKEAQLNHVGCFKYSSVRGAKAHTLYKAVPENIKEEREETLMLLQKDIVEAQAKQKRGKVLPVIVDLVTPKCIYARSQGDAPEIDGRVLINTKNSYINKIYPGDFLDVKITRHKAYDLYGVLDSE